MISKHQKISPVSNSLDSNSLVSNSLDSNSPWVKIKDILNLINPHKVVSKFLHLNPGFCNSLLQYNNSREASSHSLLQDIHHKEANQEIRQETNLEISQESKEVVKI